MSQYYYCYSLPLESGSVIKPGNWGRILKTYTPDSGNPWVIIRELIFEQIRQVDYPDKPSRLSSIFTCLDKTEIVKFRDNANRKLDLVYEVELVDPSLPVHISDYTLANIHKQDTMESLVHRASIYWQGDKNSTNNQELITESPIRIITEVT